jgi:predicted MFS family arabinose efflux permease
MGIVGMSGPGALVTTVPVTKWFVRQRGQALAYMSLGVPVGGLLFVPLTQILIDVVGWRAAWVWLAIIGAGLIVPLALLFVRRQPEDMGLLPDGAAQLAAASTSQLATAPPPDERSWTRGEALRSATFWRLVVVFSLVMLAIGSVGVHRIPNFMDKGLDARLIAYATALDAAAAGLSTFATGLLTRRFPARFIGAGGFLLLMLASVLTILADDHLVMFVSMIIFGVGIGVMMLMQSFLWADYFGRRHQGSIRGAVMPITLVFSAAGAPIAGYVRDFTGSYVVIWLVAAGLMALGAVVLALTPSPQPRPAETPPQVSAVATED